MLFYEQVGANQKRAVSQELPPLLDLLRAQVSLGFAHLKDPGNDFSTVKNWHQSLAPPLQNEPSETRFSMAGELGSVVDLIVLADVFGQDRFICPVPPGHPPR